VNNSTDKSLAFQPRKLVSLWDMIQLHVVDLMTAINATRYESEKLAKAQAQFGVAGILTEHEIKKLFHVLALVTKQSQNLKLQKTLTRITPLGLKLNGQRGTYQIIQTALDDMLLDMIGDVSHIKCAFIPADTTRRQRWLLA
jgi:hypothetical protein